MAKKVIQRQVVIGYKHTICKVDKKGKFEPIETVTSERPVFSAKRLNEYQRENNLADTPLYALPEGKVTELYEMDLDFFMEHARKVEDVVETTETAEGEEQ